MLNFQGLDAFNDSSSNSTGTEYVINYLLISLRTFLAVLVSASGLGGLNGGVSFFHTSSFCNTSGLSKDGAELLFGIGLGVDVHVLVRKFIGL